ncbi:NAD-dependent epimerase/dehydratase family protein [Mucilaginibacter corticis]|uniref:NAD-dependent epimerase/dehydratase family protein n=1 Tax=Mucilaginibacter corticis TaxID=2597670 RepID=A0A556M7T7_9SPHI|nr:NAD-dependent epimerase/dehydratase family protein [Mucilaginibacter corticis]TSJ35895.1 NAD-dependent epimerase/dehydratase family protein [Mucilaginibacter corticis]
MNKILVIGACGQIGTELVSALKAKHGDEAVLAADVRLLDDVPFALRPYVRLNVLDRTELRGLALKEKIGTVYHLVAMLSATGEKQPLAAWDLNMQGLLNVLEIAKSDRIRVFWPSSIAVFGPASPVSFCPQHAVTEPATVYGISKVAGELWCKYYHDQYGVDVRSIRYPGLISYTAQPGGGTTDYAVDIFHQALKHKRYQCYLKSDTTLPMMYMPDAIRATLELMDAPADRLTVRTGYNLHALSFTPDELAREIQSHIPEFKITYQPDYRQQIADSWPSSVNDRDARLDWGWQRQFDLHAMVADMLSHLK